VAACVGGEIVEAGAVIPGARQAISAIATVLGLTGTGMALLTDNCMAECSSLSSVAWMYVRLPSLLCPVADIMAWLLNPLACNLLEMMAYKRGSFVVSRR